MDGGTFVGFVIVAFLVLISLTETEGMRVGPRILSRHHLRHIWGVNQVPTPPIWTQEDDYYYQRNKALSQASLRPY